MSTLLRCAATLLLAFPLSLFAQTTNSTARIPVLVELFTSEGCSSCPPADKLLASLQSQQPVAGAQIIVVEEHVDYWDRQGWRDRFSSAQFTQRQNFYLPRLRFDDPYTPQMIVDGQSQFLGSDASKALVSISQASHTPKIGLTLAKPVIDGKHVSGSVSVTSEDTALPKGDLYAILIDPSASTEVKAGENSGRHMDHVSVARFFQRIGKLQDLAHGPVSFKLNAPDSDDPAQMRLIVFAQLPEQGAVRGVAEIETTSRP